MLQLQTDMAPRGVGSVGAKRMRGADAGALERLVRGAVVPLFWSFTRRSRDVVKPVKPSGSCLIPSDGAHSRGVYL